MRQKSTKCRRHDTLFHNDFHYYTQEDCLAQLQLRPWQPNGCVCIGGRCAFNVLIDCIGEAVRRSTPLPQIQLHWQSCACVATIHPSSAAI